MLPAGLARRRRDRRRSLAGLLIAALATLAAMGCGRTGSGTTEGRSAVLTWVATDLSFGDDAACVGPYLRTVPLDGVDLDSLRTRGLDALAFRDRQRVADAIVVCGLGAGQR